MTSKHERNISKLDNIAWMNFLFILLVLLLHHVNYTQDYLWDITHRFINPYESGISQIFQKLAVGGFLFLSGYKLAIAKRSEPAREFLLKRFLRIYPLYFLSVVLFSLTVYPHINGERPTFGNFAIHALALQAWLPNFYQNNYLTIWFVSNLLFCYFMFILLRRYLSNTGDFSLAVLVIVLSINLIKIVSLNLYKIEMFSGHFDTYFLFFAFGMLLSRQHEQSATCARKRFFFSFLILITCAVSFVFMNLFLSPNEPSYPIIERVFVLGFTLPTFYLLLRMPIQESLSTRLAYTINYVGSASFCVFLFHRPIWTVMYEFTPEKSYLQSLFILGLGIPLIFIFSYQVQSFYNSKISLFLHSTK